MHAQSVRVSKFVTTVCVPVVSDGREPSEIDPLVFPEVQTGSRTLRRSHHLLLSAAVNVYYSHRGFLDRKRDINNKCAGR